MRWFLYICAALSLAGSVSALFDNPVHVWKAIEFLGTGGLFATGAYYGIGKRNA